MGGSERESLTVYFQRLKRIEKVSVFYLIELSCMMISGNADSRFSRSKTLQQTQLKVNKHGRLSGLTQQKENQSCIAQHGSHSALSGSLQSSTPWKRHKSSTTQEESDNLEIGSLYYKFQWKRYKA